jgi:L-threonylcarbamoyladenylate synthase
MDTKIEKMNCDEVDLEKIEEFAQLLKEGKTVIFPTETVYGLGANALDEEAAQKIYEAKGRPNDNPLIVHIYDKKEVYNLAKEVPDTAKLIIDKFWPGPITIILNKKSIIPSRTSGGLDTVAIRMPSNKIARALIKAAGLPIAAPSANISGRPSPTRSEHVINEMNGRVSGIITGGDCNFGLESTVLDLTSDKPMILRPGSVTKEELEAVLGEVLEDPTLNKKTDNNVKAKAPGMKYTHYSPNADVYVVYGSDEGVIEKINSLVSEDREKGLKSGVMCMSERVDKYDGTVVDLGESLEEVASNLFDALIEMDKENVDVVYSEIFPMEGVGQAIMNRLLKSAGYKMIRAEGKKDILVVCSGNTCRSAIGEFLLKEEIKNSAKSLDNYYIHSAGVTAIEGLEASENAVSVLKEIGIEAKTHESTVLTEKMVEDASLILTMTNSHKNYLLQTLPKNKDKVYTLKGFAGMGDSDVIDPFGGGIDIYRKTRTEIGDCVKKIVQKI